MGCGCSICLSTDPKNKRTRASILITTKEGKNIVVDTGPDFRQQALISKIKKIDAILYTHIHADHCNGFDDLRAFRFFDETPIPTYLLEEQIEPLKSRFLYAFSKTGYSGVVPSLSLIPMPMKSFPLLGLDVDVIKLNHGDIDVCGFKFGTFAYVTDFKSLSETQIKRWAGSIDTMIASGVHFGSHPCHSVIPETVELFKQLQVKKGYITHISHEVDYAKHSRNLPEGVEFAYDGLNFVIDLA
jgi:phosphoribosyl 1,2-cyclic phosphodiesterase